MSETMCSQTFFRFNTVNTISIDTNDTSLIGRVITLCDHYDFLFSRPNPTSELYRLNHAQGRPTNVDPELAALIDTSLAYCAKVQGVFDITMGAVTQLWDFHHGRIPSADSIQSALHHVDYSRVHVQGSTVTIDDPQACIDLGGIAKGYIADGILADLRGQGVRHAYVNLGGNVAVMGGKIDESPWNIGIREPIPSTSGKTPEPWACVEMADGSVVTSGIYERAFESNGVLYHHILDPHTGYPAHTDLLGATIMSDTSLDGDGFTTALIIMGAQQALHFAESYPGIEALLMTKSGEVLATSGLGQSIPLHIRADRPLPMHSEGLD